MGNHPWSMNFYLHKRQSYVLYLYNESFTFWLYSSLATYHRKKSSNLPPGIWRKTPENCPSCHGGIWCNHLVIFKKGFFLNTRWFYKKIGIFFNGFFLNYQVILSKPTDIFIWEIGFARQAQWFLKICHLSSRLYWGW